MKKIDITLKKNASICAGLSSGRCLGISLGTVTLMSIAGYCYQAYSNSLIYQEAFEKGFSDGYQSTSPEVIIVTLTKEDGSRDGLRAREFLDRERRKE